MNIRTYQSGDEAVQVAIYNEAAAKLPKFKAATVEEICRRCQAADFDPGTRLYAEEGGKVVGYAAFHANGRVSYPWCLPGHESCADALFQHMLQAMRQRGLRLAFAAYRADWPAQLAFFREQGFRHARDMVNFVLDVLDMPTPAAPLRDSASPLRREDLPAVFKLAPAALRIHDVAELERHLFQNPYFSAADLFVTRDRKDGSPIAVAILIANPAYADPKQIDAAMPCFRLGAFGTEGMQVKRVNGMFSFLVNPERQVLSLALDLMGIAGFRMEGADSSTMTAQVPSDVPHLLGFYQRFFQKQGSFPVLELAL